MGLFDRKSRVTPLQVTALNVAAIRIQTILEGKGVSSALFLPSSLCLVGGVFGGCIAIDMDGGGRDGYTAITDATYKGFELLLGTASESRRCVSELNLVLRRPSQRDRHAMDLGMRLSMMKFSDQHDYFDPYDRLEKYLLADAGSWPNPADEIAFFDEMEKAIPVPADAKQEFESAGFPNLRREFEWFASTGDAAEVRRTLLDATCERSRVNLGAFWGAFWYGMPDLPEGKAQSRIDLYLTWILGDRLYARLVWSAAWNLRQQKDVNCEDGYRSGHWWMRRGADGNGNGGRLFETDLPRKPSSDFIFLD